MPLRPRWAASEMAKTPSRRLVIDASVAGRAGGRERLHPAGKRCRDFLEAVRTICHRVVMTPEIREEWAEHQLSFARKWRAQMFARKKVDRVEVKPDESLLRRLQKTEATERHQEEMHKDWPLVEAAMATDGSVISLDEAARSLFARASRAVAELSQIVWVNPDPPEEHPVAWLEAGAEPERERMLGWSG